MLFSSPEFFLFFAVYFSVHLVLPPKYRMHLIVFGGLFFYGYWDPSLLWVPILLVAIAWVGVQYSTNGENAGTPRLRTAVVVTALLLPLLIVKYTNFFLRDVVGMTMPTNGEVLQIGIPLGISFVTFTAIAYVVDVYRGRFPPERNIFRLMGYVAFFPHLIAGPILRPHELLPQLIQQRSAWRARFMFGATIFALGLVKKLVFADQLAQHVDLVYAGEENLGSLDYVLAIYGFSVQIYCDFSGYTDMAIGLAAMLRVKLPTNFRNPYTSASIVEFWRRWHITLSHWLRDYLYIPLGGNRRGLAAAFRNVLITMGIGGLWHGANWNFLFWGLLHGSAIVLAQAMRAGLVPPIKLPKWLAVALTFHVVTFAWIFFRAPDLATVARIFHGVFTAGTGDIGSFATANALPLILIVLFALTHRFDQHARVAVLVKRTPRPALIGVLVMSFVMSIVISAGNSAKFIYFDF